MTFFGKVPCRERGRAEVVALPRKEEPVAQNGGGGSRLDGSEASTPSSSALAQNDGAVVVAPPGNGEPVTQNGGGGSRLDGSEVSTPTLSALAQNDGDVMVAPPGKEPVTQNGDGGSHLDGFEASTMSSVCARNDGSAAVVLTKYEEDRLRKGKMVAVDQSPPSANDDAAPRRGQPPGEKLMGDAIRSMQSHEDTTALAVKVIAENNKKRKHRDRVFWAGMGQDGQSTSSAGADMDVSLDNLAVVDDKLRDILRDLGASPVRIYGKKLSLSDRTTHQNRLLMSCKSWHTDDDEPFPFDEIMTEEEKPDVRNKGPGLFVQAYDRDGQLYTLKCKHLICNNAYRLIGDWGKFLRRHGLVAKGKKVREDAMIELWAFRSQKLELGVANQPDGRLGLVMVHYLQGDAAHANAALVGNEVEEEEKAGSDENVLEALSENGVAMPDGDVGGYEMVVEDAVEVVENAVPVSLADAADVDDDAVPDTVDEQDKAAPIVANEVGAQSDRLLGATPDEVTAAAEALLMLRAAGSF